MSRLENIIEHLTSRYHPTAIILHGSRATGMTRPHSDWDLVLLAHTPLPVETVRQEVLGENLELKTFLLPVASVAKTFGAKLRKARAVYDPEGVGQELLDRANAMYAKPLDLPPIKKRGQLLHLRGKLYGMEDMLEQPGLFLKYLDRFYESAMDLWFQNLHNRWSLPPVEALPEIEKNDPDYYRLLVRIAADAVPNAKRLVAARELYALLESRQAR